MADTWSLSETLEAKEREKALEADRAQIDARIAENWIDIEWARAAMWGMGKLEPEKAGEVAQEVASAEKWEPEPDIDFSAFDIAPAWAWDNTLVWSAWKDELASEEETWKTEEGAKNNVPETDSKNPEVLDTSKNKVIPSWEGKNPEWKEIIDTNKEGEYTPLLIDFAKTGKLSPDELTTVLQANITPDNFKETISGLDISPQAQAGITKSLSYLNSEGHQKQSREAIMKDFPNMIGEEFKNQKWADTLTSDHAEAALANISRHYIGEATADPAQKEADLRRALLMASNALSAKWGSMLSPENEFRFQKNKKKVSNPNASLTDIFNAVTDNTELVSTEAGIKSSSREEMNDGDAPWDTDFEAKLIAAWEFEAFQQAQEAVLQAQETNNPSAIQLAEAQRDKILAKANITWWEASLLTGWKLDRSSDTLWESTPKTA